MRAETRLTNGRSAIPQILQKRPLRAIPASEPAAQSILLEPHSRVDDRLRHWLRVAFTNATPDDDLSRKASFRSSESLAFHHCGVACVAYIENEFNFHYCYT